MFFSLIIFYLLIIIFWWRIIITSLDPVFVSFKDFFFFPFPAVKRWRLMWSFLEPFIIFSIEILSLKSCYYFLLMCILFSSLLSFSYRFLRLKDFSFINLYCWKGLHFWWIGTVETFMSVYRFVHHQGPLFFII